MDLSTIVRSIEAGVYSPEWKGGAWQATLAADVDLVWRNPLTHSLTLTHSFIHSLTHSLTHSHSLTLTLTLVWPHQVWSNALAYNPADSVVAQSARELQVRPSISLSLSLTHTHSLSFSLSHTHTLSLQEGLAPQWAKLVEEEGEQAEPAVEGADPKLLVMNHYAFVTKAGMVIFFFSSSLLLLSSLELSDTPIYEPSSEPLHISEK